MKIKHIIMNLLIMLLSIVLFSSCTANSKHTSKISEYNYNEDFFESTQDSKEQTTQEQTTQEQSTQEQTLKMNETVSTTVQPSSKRDSVSKTESSTKEIKKKKTEKKPIDIPRGYSTLQAYYLHCTEDKTIDELESLAKKCGLFVNRLAYTSPNTGEDIYVDLEVSEKKIEYELYKGLNYEYECDYILVKYEKKGDHLGFSGADYNFLNKVGTVVFEPDGMIYIDGKIKDDKYYIIKKSMYDRSDRYYNAKEVMDAAIKESKKKN